MISLNRIGDAYTAYLRITSIRMTTISLERTDE